VEVHIKSCAVSSMLVHVFLLLKLIYMGFRFKFLILKKLPWPIIAYIVYISQCFASYHCLCKLLLLYISECTFHKMILLIVAFLTDTLTKMHII